MLYLSVSAVKDYLTCPRIYWYRVHNKQAFVGDKYIFKGNVVHEAVEKHDNEEDAILFTHKKYVENSNYAGNASTDELESFTMLHNYYTIIEPQLSPRQPEYIEKTFKIPWDKYGVNIVGKIDRIDRENDSLYDWKTAIQKPDAYELQDMQFYMYAWAYESLYRVKPKVYYGHLYSGEIFPIDIHEDMWYNYKQLISEIAYKLDTKDGFYPRLFGYKCKKCFYKGACWSDYELGN